MQMRLLPIMLLTTLLSLGCGNDQDDSAPPATGGLPQSICPMDAAVSTAGNFQSLDHDGGHSDLKLQWEVYRQQGYACSGSYDFTLRAKNISEHSDAHRVWFTIIMYHGDEYMNDLSIYPRGITIPVGETQEFNLNFDIADEFASAPDGREITAAIIIQTDNPNWSDPDAFFTRTWLRLVPASDCDAEPMAQPEPHMLSIHSETCKQATVKLQTHSSLMDGFPQSEVISGPLLLNGSVYAEGNFYYQSLHVADRIAEGTRAEVDMFSNERDRIRFYFQERVDCEWVHTPIHPPGDDDDGEVTAPDPSDPEKPDEPVDPKPDNTREEEFVRVSACGAALSGSVVPPAAGPVTGRTWKTVAADGAVELFVDLQHLPEASIGEGSDGWVQGVQSGQYVAWLVRHDGDRRHLLPLKAFSPDDDGSARLSVALDAEAVAGLDGNQGTWVDGNGNSTPATESVPLSAFEGFVITLQPSGEHHSPNGMVMGGGWLTPSP